MENQHAGQDELNMKHNEHLMERYIDHMGIFKGLSSPSYMVVSYSRYARDPVAHAFNMARQAALGIQNEPLFKKQFIDIRKKCREFTVAILDCCQTSFEVELR